MFFDGRALCGKIAPGYQYAHERGGLLLTADLHLHPLNHRYYPASPPANGLSDDDRDAIRTVVDWCAGPRGLDVIAITDHDMILPGLYAQAYAAEKGYDLRVLPGAECEVRDPLASPGMDKIHILCYGLRELPAHYPSSSLTRFGNLSARLSPPTIDKRIPLRLR